MPRVFCFRHKCWIMSISLLWVLVAPAARGINPSKMPQSTSVTGKHASESIKKTARPGTNGSVVNSKRRNSERSLHYADYHRTPEASKSETLPLSKQQYDRQRVKRFLDGKEPSLEVDSWGRRP